MVIFNSYVSLPEGISSRLKLFPIVLQPRSCRVLKPRDSGTVYWYCRAVSSEWFVLSFSSASICECRRSHTMAPIHSYPPRTIISIRVTCTWTVAGLHLQILNVRPSEWHSHRRETACVSGRDAVHSLAPLVLLLASRAARWVSPWMQRWEKIIPDWGHINEILATMRRPTVQVGLLSIHLP